MDLTTLKLSHNVAIVVRPSFTINFKMYRRRHTPIPCMYECGRLYAIAREWDDDESEEKKTHTATGQFKLSTVVVQKKRTTSTRTQRNSVNCPNTSTDSTSSRLSTTTHGPHCARIQMHLHTLNIQVTTHWNCRRRERM